jgi:hypothetical protein
VGSTTSEGQLDFGYYGWPQCDGDGNMYFRTDLVPNFEKNRILKVSPKAERLAEFSLPNEFKDFLGGPFAAGLDGNFFQVAYDGEQFLVLEFSADGRFSGKTKLNISSPEHFLPENLAVFPTGEILLAGFYSSSAPKAVRNLSRVGIYHPDGRLLTRVSTKMPDGSNELPRDWMAASGDYIAMGVDGSAYFLRSSRILVVSPSGEIVRTIKVASPSGGYAASKIEISGSITSLVFQKVEKSRRVSLLFRTYDLTTGELLREYVPDPTLGNSVLCFSANEGYTFFGNEHGRLQIKRGWIQ